MSKLSPDKHSLNQCRVCSKTLSLNSTRQGKKYNISKMTSCYKIFSCLHIKCDRKFALVMDASYKFDALTYKSDDNSTLYCFLCEKNCFYYDKKYTLNVSTEEITTDVCSQCNKWCYYYNKCNTDSIETVCTDCIEDAKDDATIDKDLLPPSLSPITILCDKERFDICSKILELIAFEYNSPYTVEQWKSYIVQSFTHLHPDNHNIFSPNTINKQPADGMLLYSYSLLHLL